MSLLSRVANRVYWAARYLERAENSARLVNVYGALLLDVPEEAGFSWETLVRITGSEALFNDLCDEKDAGAPARFLTGDERNPGSILSSLAEARENMRTTRDIVPSEAWRCTNELYLYASERLRRGLSDRRRHEVLTGIVERCQRVTGLLSGTMSHGPAYQFIRVGRNLERGDMTTRVIDVAAAELLKDRADARFDNTLWMAVLRSLSAYQMYRQYVRRRIVAQDVIAFLLQDAQFPRSLLYCLDELELALATLPRSEAPRKGVGRLQRMCAELDVAGSDFADLHEWIDDVQLELIRVNDLIRNTWLTLEDAA